MSFSLQKANFWKRVSAYIFDMLIAVMLAVAFAGVFSILFGYTSHAEKMQSLQRDYYIQYGLQIPVSAEVYDTLSAEEKNNYITTEDYEQLSEEKKAVYEEVSKEIASDPEMQALQSKMFTLSFAIVSLGVFCSHFLWYFLLPLFFKNGQTLGKKCFGLAVIRTNGVKTSTPVLFVRSMLGLYTMETMAPLLFVWMILFGSLGYVGIITILGIFLLQIFVMIKTPTNSCIHDLLSDTVVVDFASQQIFDSQEDLIAWQQEQAALEAQNTEV